MAVYQDSNGKQWKIRLTPVTGDKVRRETTVDLQDVKTFETLSEPGTLSKVCYILAGEPENYDAFADGIDGDTLDRMEAALWDEIENFSRAKMRPILKQIREKIRQVETLAETKAAKEIGAITAEEIFASIVGNTVSNSAATLGQTQSE